jgi:CSLREA domain-containing protein
LVVIVAFALAFLTFVGVVLLALPSGPAGAEATFVVNSTGDASDRRLSDAVCDTSRKRGKQCTLRAALQEANVTENVADPDVINFNIGGTTSVKTISPASPLPELAGPTFIDGYTQRGARPNTLATGNNAVLKVQIDGTGAGTKEDGLRIRASRCTIRGLVINRFVNSGVQIGGVEAIFNRVEGNFIGTSADGRGDLGNGTNGVQINSAPDNTIGGTEPEARNVISGNTGDGIRIVNSEASGNSVEGNFIGTNASGTRALANREGVDVSVAPNNTIGGTTTGARNVISGNLESGVKIIGSAATGNRVEGNFIGTNASGAQPLGNGSDGVTLTSANNTIGGTAPGARNVISGNGSVNGDNGIHIAGSDATDNRVEGNLIGTDASGSADVGNHSVGVGIESANNTIGGTAGAARNVISGNDGGGVRISTVAATGNKVEGNTIGRTADGSAALNNAGLGVFIFNAPDNTVGGAAANVISSSLFDGVRIIGAGASGNRVLSNSIHSNGDLGIDLAGTIGITNNDTDDGDTGPNNLQNFPLIVSASRSPTTGFTTITGTLNSNPSQSFAIQCFLTDAAPADAHGEGLILLGATTTTTDSSGDSPPFSCVSPIPVSGQTVSMTATNTVTGDTSEFSQNEVVIQP